MALPDSPRQWRCARCPRVLGYIAGGALRLVVDGARWHGHSVSVRCPDCRARQRFDLRDLVA